MVWLSITARNSGHNRVDGCKVLSYWESKCGKNRNRLRFIEKVLITVQAEYLWSGARAAQKRYRIYRALFKLNIYLALSFLFLFIMQQNIIFWFIMKLLSFHPLSPLSHFSRSQGSLRKEILCWLVLWCICLMVLLNEPFVFSVKWLKGGGRGACESC